MDLDFPSDISSESEADNDMNGPTNQLHGMQRDKGICFLNGTFPIKVAAKLGGSQFLRTGSAPHYVLADVKQLLKLFESRCPRCCLSPLENCVLYVGCVMHCVLHCSWLHSLPIFLHWHRRVSHNRLQLQGMSTLWRLCNSFYTVGPSQCGSVLRCSVSKFAWSYFHWFWKAYIDHLCAVP